MIYQKTARGHKVLQDRSIPLAPKHRMIFILFDGKTTTADILKSAVGLGVDRADVLDLIELGLIEPVRTEDKTSPSQFPSGFHQNTESTTQPSSIYPPQLTHPNSTANTEPPQVPNAKQANQFDLDAAVKQMRFQNAYPLAVQITSNLGLGGFRLNLAIEHAMNYEDLVALLPRIEKAAGPHACAKLHELLLQPISN